MDEDSICLLAKLLGRRNCIVKGSSCELDGQPLTSMTTYIVYFDLRSVRRHENGSFYLEQTTTICNSLSMVTRTCSCYSPVFFLLSQSAKSSGCSSYLEAADRLQILPFKKDISFVLFGEKGGSLQFGVSDNGLIFAVGLVDGGSWYYFGLVFHKICWCFDRTVPRDILQ